MYKPHDRIKVYVTKVENTSKGPQIFVSRSHPDLLKRLFEQEVPEIYDGVVEIVSIAREAGDRAKVAVRSREENIDPVGTCVGPKGQRVQAIVNELKGENMDIVEWDADPATYIGNALNPAQVVSVTFNEAAGSCLVVVPDYQLSLAIGKRGQNARLAAKLTGYKIDIKSETDMAAIQLAKEEAGLVKDAEYAEVIETIESQEQEMNEEEIIQTVEDLDTEFDEITIDADIEEGNLDAEAAEELIELAEERNNVED